MHYMEGERGCALPYIIVSRHSQDVSRFLRLCEDGLMTRLVAERIHWFPQQPRLQCLHHAARGGDEISTANARIALQCYIEPQYLSTSVPQYLSTSVPQYLTTHRRLPHRLQQQTANTQRPSPTATTIPNSIPDLLKLHRSSSSSQ